MKNLFKLMGIFILIISSILGNINHPQHEDIVITLSGELASENSTFIKTPEFWNLQYKIVYLPPEGTWVEVGDTVVAFDSKEVEEQLEEIMQNLERIEKSLEEKQLTNEQTIKEINNSIKQLEIEKEIVLNQLEQSKYNSQTDQQDAELELKKVELNITKTKQALASQKILNKNSENETIIQLEQYQTRIKDFKRMMSMMHITAPKTGIVVYHSVGHRGKGEKVKVGDDVRPSTTILQIPDLNNMIAEVELNEVDISKIDTGQTATISVLAYPDTTFTGHVSFISKIADENDNSKLRIYPVEIKLDGMKNYRLKPGLTVKIDLVIEKMENHFSIPSWCLFHNEDGYYVRIKTKSIPVEIIKIYDGKAYVHGELDTEMQLIENQNIPNF